MKHERKSKMYPSQARYLENNPVISFHVKKKEKEKIDAIVAGTGKSVSQLVREALFGHIEKNIDPYEKGLCEGLNEATEKNHIWYYCSECKYPITIKPMGSTHLKIIKILLDNGWGHVNCPKNEDEFYERSEAEEDRGASEEDIEKFENFLEEEFGEDCDLDT